MTHTTSNKIDIVQLLAELPKNARESILYSLSGSANAGVINTAQFIVGLCDREGLHIQEEVELHHFMNVQEMAKASAEHGTGTDWFVAATNSVTWANQVRDMFIATTGKDIGDLQSTLDFMASKPRLMKQTDAMRTAEFLNALDDAGITADDVKLIFDTEAMQRCQDMKVAKHNITLVMHALPAADIDDPFSALTERQQASVVDKTLAALLRVRNQLMLSITRPGSNQDIGDYAFIGAAIRQLKVAQPSAADILKAAGRATHEEPCSTAPVHNVHMSELQASYTTGKLGKAAAVQKVRDHMKCSKFDAAQTVAAWPAPKHAPKRVATSAPKLATPEQLQQLVTQ